MCGGFYLTGALSFLSVLGLPDLQDATTFTAAGLLASGIIPAVRHCLDNLLTTDARIIPASATVFAQVPSAETFNRQLLYPCMEILLATAACLVPASVDALAQVHAAEP